MTAAKTAELPPFQEALLLGQHALYSGRPDDATSLLDEAVRRNPESVAAQGALTVAHQHCGNFEHWLDSAISIIDLKPKSSEDYLLKAQAIVTVGDPEQARVLADKAIELKYSPLALASRAEILAWVAMDQNDFSILAPAIEDICALRRTLPNPSAFVLNADLLIHLAALIMGDPARRDEYAKSADYAVTRLADLFPRYEFGRYHRANFFALTGQDELAEAEWRALIELKRRPAWVIDYAQVLYRNGKYDVAKKEVGSLGPSPQVFFGAHILGEDPACRSQMLEQIETSYVSQMEEFALRSLMLLGERRRATELAQDRLMTLPSRKGSWPAWEHAKIRYYAQPDFTETDLLEAAGDSIFKRCDAHCLLGVAAFADGDFPTAETHFNKAIATRAVWFESYQMADGILRRRRSEPEWPNWIAVDNPFSIE